MEERRSLLRRKIDLLREYLKEGVDISIASSYLREIAEAELELRNTGRLPKIEHC